MAVLLACPCASAVLDRSGTLYDDLLPAASREVLVPFCTTESGSSAISVSISGLCPLAVSQWRGCIVGLISAALLISTSSGVPEVSRWPLRCLRFYSCSVSSAFSTAPLGHFLTWLL